jgi:hypothetical protein
MWSAVRVTLKINFDSKQPALQPSATLGLETVRPPVRSRGEPPEPVPPSRRWESL